MHAARVSVHWVAMSVIAFTRNYTDHSNDTGYQFEFHCDKCGNGFRSTFHMSKLGVGSKIAKGLGSIFGGSLWSAGQATDYMKDGLRGQAWDSAFRDAIEEIRPKFHQCTRCGHWVCPEICWNEQRQLCEDCAPNLAEEAAAQQAQIAVEQVGAKLRSVDQIAGFDPSAEMVSSCPSCHGGVQPGAKFCPGCGKPVGAGAAKAFCSGCGAQLAAGARFCAGCGQAAG
jgi:double zinc ribbon protein